MQASDDKSPDAFRTISEVAESMELPQHVLRFWETRFPQIKPLKRGGGRRYYRPDDVELLKAIKRLLYDQGYTIKGVQKLLRDHGVHAVTRGEVGQGGPPPPELDDLAPAPAVRAERTEPTLPFPSPEAPPPREDLPQRPPPQARGPAVTGSRLSAADAARLRATLGELREAERQLRLAREL